MALLDWFIFLVVFYVIIDFFCVNTSIQDEDRIRQLTTVVVVPNAAAEDKPEDDLPPYTPPTPKTQAAIADLPPSYEETWDITDANINANNASNNMINDNSNVNMNTSNNVNLPVSYNINTNSVPDIIVNPVNTRNTPVA